VPRDARLRECFVAEPGHVLIAADYSVIQLRILADVSHDVQLMRCFMGNPPVDPHVMTAALLLAKDVETVSPQERTVAKAINFGFAFGMGLNRFISHARNRFGVMFTAEQAQEFQERFFDVYRGVRDWQFRTWSEFRGSARSASGRLRLLPHGAARYAYLNTPIQGTEADGLKRALALLHPQLAAIEAHLVNVIHDELVVSVPADRAEHVKAVVVRAMVAGMQEFVPAVPIDVEASVSPRWKKP
jgi:DNA polymerase I-like protein with 3'-5' exonuclease and polymerase domains